MATIHHATVKSAASKGVTLQVEDNGAVSATQGERTFHLSFEPEGDEPTQAEWTDAAKDVWNTLAEVLAFEGEPEGKGIQIEQDGGDFVAVRTEDGEEIARDPELADLFETLRERAAEGDDEGDDEEKESNSVVPDGYKQRYAAAGHPNTCGDWLAVVLNERCLTADGKTFRVEPMLAIADANGVDAERYMARKTRGWQGRFRMTTRNVLKGVVATKGVLIVPAEANIDGRGDEELAAPADWIAANLPKAKGKAAVAK